MRFPFIGIDLSPIVANTRIIVDVCRRQGIEPAGVTKGFCGDPKIAKAMLAGGVSMLADARVQNLQRLRRAGITAPLLLLRVPMQSQIKEVIRLADYCVVSEI